MGISISFVKSTKRTNLKHNNRTMNEKERTKNPHINWDKTKGNYYLVQKDLREIYHEQFDEALEKYNAKQKRSDRKIKNYYDHIKKSKKTALQQEMIIQIGDKDTYPTEESKEVGATMLKNWFEGFQERNPQLIVYNAAIHMDEATPHMHLNFVPVATGYKRGLEKQVAFDKAILQQNATLNPERPFDDWREFEVSFLEKELNQLGYQRELVGKNDYKDVRDYKYRKDLEREIEKLEENAKNIQEKVSNLSEKQKVGVKYLDYLESLKTQKNEEIRDLDELLEEKHIELSQIESSTQTYVAELTKKHEKLSLRNAELEKGIKTNQNVISSQMKDIQAIERSQKNIAELTSNAVVKKPTFGNKEPMVIIPKSDFKGLVAHAKKGIEYRRNASAAWNENESLRMSLQKSDKAWEQEKKKNRQLSVEYKKLKSEKEALENFVLEKGLMIEFKRWFEEFKKWLKEKETRMAQKITSRRKQNGREI